MYQLIHSILLISFLLPSLGLAQRSPKEQTKDTPWTKAQWEQLDALFATDEPEQVQPGLAFALLHRGELIYQQTPGYANLEHQIPLNAQSCFDIASLAKQFTGLSVAILIEEGKLSLQDDVRQYLPEVPDFGHPITIAHLLYHTSGLRDIGELHAVGPYLDELTAKMCLEIVSHQQELNFVPGTENDYSNTGYVLLALIVERVSGTSFVD
ncbi:MAG: serine hydrolase domain-containing protein, partial [Bacteroidota bacterium]